jgi:CRP-like cAMP-binding protein
MPFDDTIFLKKNVDILSFFTDEQLRNVTAVLEHRQFDKGQTVMFQGELTNSFFIIKKGSVLVTAKSGGDKAQLAELKAGDFFGEMSLLESTAATATIKANEANTEILMISHEAFQYLLKQNPLLESTLRQRISTRKLGKSQALPKKDA